MTMARRADAGSTDVRQGGLGGPKQRRKRHFDMCSKGSDDFMFYSDGTINTEEKCETHNTAPGTTIC